MRFERAETCQVVRGREHVDVWQRCLHAARERFVRRTAEQWIQPDQSPGPPLQLRKRLRKLRRIAGVPAVAQDDHYGTLIDASKPLGVECREAFANACSARPSAYFR